MPKYFKTADLEDDVSITGNSFEMEIQRTYIQLGKLIPANLLEESLTIESLLPPRDIIGWRSDRFLVSESAKAFFLQRAPRAQYHFTPMRLEWLGSNIIFDYFLLQVLSTTSKINWKQSRTTVLTGPQGDGITTMTASQSRNGDLSFYDASYPWDLWRETPVRDGDIEYYISRSAIFMTDSVWRELRVAYPGQIADLWPE